MQGFAQMLNNMLVEVYHNILRVEEEFLKNNNRINLSIREMHLIECVGMNREEGKTVSEIAEYLKVARPSVTVAVNKLERKGYLEKQGCRTTDGSSRSFEQGGPQGGRLPPAVPYEYGAGHRSGVHSRGAGASAAHHCELQ